MKTNILLLALVLSGTLMTAQSEKTADEKKAVTVRVKKIENINGVEKVTDTTYTTTDIHRVKGANCIEVDGNKNGTKEVRQKIMIVSDDSEHVNVQTDGKTGIRTITVNSEENKDGTPVVKKIVLTNKDGVSSEKIMVSEGELSEDMKKALEETKVKLHGMEGKDGAIVISNELSDGEEGKGKKITKVVILQQIKITELSAEDEALLNKTTNVGDRKLQADEMMFYPNPNNGKFNLAFYLADKGDTEIHVMNIEGKKVYSEKLVGFSGKYDREIDISQNPKGIYFVKIAQGKHTQVKKIVLK